MSAIIAGLVPKIEGFQPIPNAVMIPFMEAQSAALAYGFGLNYEYGKRKIRSMSNDEYNSLTSEDITNMSNAHTHIILSQFQLQVPKVMPMQAEIFKQYVTIEKLKVQQNFELAKWMLRYIKENVDDATAHLLGGHLHGEILEPFVTPKDKFINPKTGEQGAEVTPPPKPPPQKAPPLHYPTSLTAFAQMLDKFKVEWLRQKKRVASFAYDSANGTNGTGTQPRTTEFLAIEKRNLKTLALAIHNMVLSGSKSINNKIETLSNFTLNEIRTGNWTTYDGQ